MNFQSFSQEKEIPISLAYFGNFAIQPGVKVGTELDFKYWEKESSPKIQKLFISPQFAVFTRVRKNTNYFFNVNIGYKRQNKERKLYQSFSLGLGYLLQNELLSFSVNLGSGDITDKNKELRHYFLPTINYELGGYIGQKRNFGWYSQYSLGSKIAPSRESSVVVFLEVGGKLFLRKSQK